MTAAAVVDARWYRLFQTDGTTTMILLQPQRLVLVAGIWMSPNDAGCGMK